jgi:antitoxin component YwqK of YwqJK toxin-antitoxin module/peroxiredoxin
MDIIHRWSISLALFAGLIGVIPIGCGGPRVVHDEWKPGQPKRHGTVVNNVQTGEWTYWYATGTKEASGSWFQDKQDATWTWWYPDGRIKQSGSYQGQGIDLSNRSSSPRIGIWRFWHENGQLKSMGAYENDRQIGSWSWFTEQGEPYANGSYRQGVKDGDWTWWHANGQIKTSGAFAVGMKTGLWREWDNKGQIVSEIAYSSDGKPHSTTPPKVVKISAPPPALPPSEPMTVAVTPPVNAVVMTEQAPMEAASEKVEVKPAEGDNIPAATIALSPTISAPSLWTTQQEANAGQLIRTYTSGSMASTGVYSDSSFGGEGERQRRDLIGKPLPQTRFLSAAGEALDIDQLRKKGPVLLVILRGFSGQVCLYCAAQTTAISKAIKRFERNNIQVVVIYPGPVDAVPAFLQAVRSLANDPPPMPIALDVSLIAVRALNIEDNLAKPTSIFIDKQGLIRYAYVGKTIADRPSVDDLLSVGNQLAQEQK